MNILTKINYDRKIYEREDSATIYELVKQIERSLINECLLRYITPNDGLIATQKQELISDQEYIYKQKKESLERLGIAIDYDFDADVTTLTLKVKVE